VIRPGSFERNLRLLILALGDFGIACGSLALAVLIRRNIDFEITRSVLPPEKFPLDVMNVLLPGIALLLAMALSGFYNPRVSRRHRPLLLTGLVLQMAIVAVGATLLTRPYPRTILIMVPLFEAVLLPLWRRLQKRLMSVRARETVLVGTSEDIAGFLRALGNFPDTRIDVVGFITTEPVPQPIEIPCLGVLDDERAQDQLREAEEVIYVAHDESPRLRLMLLSIRRAQGFLMLPSHADALLSSTAFGWVGDQPLVEISARCGYGLGAVVKRSMDVVLGALLLIASGPIWLLIALVILADDGRPVLLRQRRAGRDGVDFLMWKFRTMRHRPQEETTPDFRLALEKDERVTRAGMWLRRHRLDELPQLLNVLTGEMSLVGPRPERPEIAAEVRKSVPAFDLRLIVRPGIAGLAQVWAEYDTEPAIKVRYDLTYITAWTPGLDIRILFRAVSTALSGRGL
jgi:exopolysaccharide biosynthesis polyprenyl glycosylphosphotransferase